MKRVKKPLPNKKKPVDIDAFIIQWKNVSMSNDEFLKETYRGVFPALPNYLKAFLRKEGITI